jgi:hypothetical protein
MTLREFANIFAQLAIQLRQTDADEATIRGYFEALKDLELEFLVMAAERLAKESDWFPKTSEWRAMAAKVEAERLDAQRTLLRKLQSPACGGCSDTGWMYDDDGRVKPCDCRKLRRLELLGRRPWPALPESVSASDSGVHAADTSAERKLLRWAAVNGSRTGSFKSAREILKPIQQRGRP